MNDNRCDGSRQRWVQMERQDQPDPPWSPLSLALQGRGSSLAFKIDVTCQKQLSKAQVIRRSRSKVPYPGRDTSSDTFFHKKRKKVPDQERRGNGSIRKLDMIVSSVVFILNQPISQKSRSVKAELLHTTHPNLVWHWWPVYFLALSINCRFVWQHIA